MLIFPRSFQFGALLALLLAGPPVQAESYRIGVVDEVKLLEAAPQAEAARKTIDKEFSPRDRELVEMQKELKRLETRLSSDGAAMSADAKRKSERKIRSNKRDLKRLQDEFREDLNFRRNEEFSKLQRVVFQAIQDVAKEHQYDLVVGEGVVLYAGKKVDLTAKVLDRLKSLPGKTAKKK